MDAQLDDLIRQLAEALTGRTRIPVDTNIEGNGALPSDLKVAFYRIAQDALNNVAKHANATHVWIVLQSQPQEATIRIRDDGQGFNPTSVPPDHPGLGIMQERAETVGAQYVWRAR